MNIPSKQAFQQVFDTAKEYARKNDADNCRERLMAFKRGVVLIHDNSETILEKAQAKSLLDKISNIIYLIEQSGVTDEVKAFFGLGIPSSPVQGTSSSVGGMGSVGDSSSDKEWSELVYDRSINGVVTVHVPGGYGTGFIISDKGYLLTNNHVVATDRRGTYHNEISMNFDGSHKCYNLTLIDADPTYDVALCKFDPKKLPSFVSLPFIPDYSTLKKGAPVVLIGNPVSQGIAPFTGTVSYTCNDAGDLVYSSPSNPGCSGGPVLDRNGFVVGINKSLTVSVGGVKTQGFTNATPANQIKKLLKKWMNEHKL